MKESWVNQHHHRHTLDFFSLSSRWFSKRFKCIFLFVNWHLRESSRDLPQEFSDVYGCRHTWTCGTEFHPLLRRNVEFWGCGESGKYLIWWSLWFVSGVRADICGSISPRSRPQGGHLPVSLPQTWNFIQQPPVTVKTPVDIQNKTKSIQNKTKSIMKIVLFLNPTTTALDRKKEKRLSLQAVLFARGLLINCLHCLIICKLRSDNFCLLLLWASWYLIPFYDLTIFSAST